MAAGTIQLSPRTLSLLLSSMKMTMETGSVPAWWHSCKRTGGSRRPWECKTSALASPFTRHAHVSVNVMTLCDQSVIKMPSRETLDSVSLFIEEFFQVVK